jgi:hypothetical protein
MSGSETDDGADKATAWNLKETRYNYSEIEGNNREFKGQPNDQGTSDVWSSVCSSTVIPKDQRLKVSPLSIDEDVGAALLTLE